MPNVYIIAGPNGAGKTTASYTLLPDVLNCIEFVNADEIAKGLSPFNVESVAIQAGRLMLQRINELINHQKDFAFETTLATRSYGSFIKKAQDLGYNITLLFLMLEDPKFALERVKQRVEDGGHNIDADVIVRRFIKGIHNLFDIYIPLCDNWLIVNNTQNRLNTVAEGGKEVGFVISDKLNFDKLRKYER